MGDYRYTHTTPPPHTPRDNVSTGAAAPPHCQSRDTGHTRDPGHGDLHGDVGDHDVHDLLLHKHVYDTVIDSSRIK